MQLEESAQATAYESEALIEPQQEADIDLDFEQTAELNENKEIFIDSEEDGLFYDDLLGDDDALDDMPRPSIRAQNNNPEARKHIEAILEKKRLERELTDIFEDEFAAYLDD